MVGVHLLFRRPFPPPAPPHARLRDRVFQHLLIQLDPDFADMTRLRIAQQVSGAANIHVVAGELKPRTKRVERFQNFETLLRLRVSVIPGS
jgi:hypothetical protein